MPRRDKKDFPSEKCEDIKEKNGMKKTRDLFKKLRNQCNISCKDGHNKERKGVALTEEEIKKRWKEYTEKLYKIRS